MPHCDQIPEAASISDSGHMSDPASLNTSTIFQIGGYFCGFFCGFLAGGVSVVIDVLVIGRDPWTPPSPEPNRLAIPRALSSISGCITVCSRLELHCLGVF